MRQFVARRWCVAGSWRTLSMARWRAVSIGRLWNPWPQPGTNEGPDMGTTAFTPPAVLTIDAGSGSCRALVFDAAGSLRGIAQREWTYHPVPGAPGGFDFDAS